MFFHLPCYDVIQPKAKLFVCDNIVFICDACLLSLDFEGDSPERKRKNANGTMSQTLLANNGDGNIVLNHRPLKSTVSNTASKPSNDQLYTMMTTMKKTLEQQTKKLDELGLHVVGARNGIDKLQSKQDDVFNFVSSRYIPPRDMAHERFRPNTAQNLANKLDTPKVVDRRTWSTVVQSRLPVTPFLGASRKKETTISLIHNATGQTVKSMKFPSPKQGKKDIQIGREIEVRQRPTRNENPMSKAIFVSPFHPETTIEEIGLRRPAHWCK